MCDPNPYTCPRCGWSCTAGFADGTEGVISRSTEHACRPDSAISEEAVELAAAKGILAYEYPRITWAMACEAGWEPVYRGKARAALAAAAPLMHRGCTRLGQGEDAAPFTISFDEEEAVVPGAPGEGSARGV